MSVIAMDLDHTLVEGDKAIDGAREAIDILRESGHRIFINTCNSLEWTRKVLDLNDIKYDRIYGETHGFGPKLLADLYVDDKGYHFKGDWPNEVNNILARVEGLDNRKW